MRMSEVFWDRGLGQKKGELVRIWYLFRKHILGLGLERMC